MWVDKYKPANIKNIIGQQSEKSNVKKLLLWLQNWHKNQFGGKKLQRPSRLLLMYLEIVFWKKTMLIGTIPV